MAVGGGSYKQPQGKQYLSGGKTAVKVRTPGGVAKGSNPTHGGAAPRPGGGRKGA